MGYSSLGDTAMAIHLRAFQERWKAGNTQEIRSETTTFVIVSVSGKSIIPAGERLPRSVGPSLPGYFQDCDESTPITLRPIPLRGPDSTCIDYNPSVSATGRILIHRFGSTHLVFDQNLSLLHRLPEPVRERGGWNSVLAADEDSNTVTVLESKGNDRAVWRRYSLPDTASPEEAFLTWPTVVRIAGYGSRVVCSELDILSGSPACWLPEGIAGFADAAQRYCADDCEWNPATGRLLARKSGQFISVEPATARESSIFDDSLLTRYARTLTK
jgi:hypothetical protein